GDSRTVDLCFIFCAPPNSFTLRRPPANSMSFNASSISADTTDLPPSRFFSWTPKKATGEATGPSIATRTSAAMCNAYRQNRHEVVRRDGIKVPVKRLGKCHALVGGVCIAGAGDLQGKSGVANALLRFFQHRLCDRRRRGTARVFSMLADLSDNDRDVAS